MRELALGFDGLSEAVNVVVSGNFDRENLLIVISQDPAVNGEVGVRHNGCCWGLGTDCGVGGES